MTKDYNIFKPFRYLTPKPKQYFDIHKQKKEKESKVEGILTGMHENAIGLIFLAITLGIGGGLLLRTCTDYVKTLEQKAEEYYQEQIYNIPDYYFK